MEVFLDYAVRLGLRDKDGQPLLKWHTPEESFEAFREVTRGRPCDYSGLTYEALRGSGGIQWPVTAQAPHGTERLYTDHQFNTRTDYTEDYGHDRTTGAAHERQDHLAMGADGRAILHAAPYQPGHEQPNDERPLLYTTGRTISQFHTRTKTARAPELQSAAPGPWVELAPADAERYSIMDADLVMVESARGRIEVPARVRGNREGVVFAPFHYGYWDRATALRRETSELLGRSRSTGLLLLADLQDAYLHAERAEIAWTVLLQGARACRDLELVETVTSVHEECETAAKWLRTRTKVAAPQVLVAG